MNDRIEELHERLLASDFPYAREAVADAINRAVGIKSAKYGIQIDPSLDGIWHNIVEPEALLILGIDEPADIHPEWAA